MGDAAARLRELELVELRLLGPLHVRRRDGRLVQGGEWRTAKTADLLRLLALADGEPVGVDEVVEALWPDADEAHGRASLRTAVSHLRALLGVETLVRRADGLLLAHVWVDTAAYERLAREAHRLLRAEDLAGGVRAGREAEALRLGPLSAHEPGAPWVGRARAAHVALRAGLLAATSEAALALGWLADAAELARGCLEEDPTSEPATRTLMQALARQGEEAAALREYERCRRALAEELGVDPAPGTREVHLQILHGRVPAQLRPPALGRRREAAALLEVLEPTRGGPATVLRLCGDTVGERRRLVAGLCAASGAALVVARDVASGLADQARARRGADAPVVVHVEGPDAEQPTPALPDGVLLVLGADHLLPGEGPLVELHPLLREELQELALDVLGDRPAGTLLTELAARSGGSHDRAVRTLQGWLAGGRVRSSGRGLVLLDQVGRSDLTALRTTLSRALQRLLDLDLEALSLLAVLDRSVSREQLASLVLPEEPAAGDRAGDASLAASLGRLSDAGLVVASGGRVGLRDALLADAVRAWLRPSALRRLHRTVAERGIVPLSDRVGHWLAVGELELACAAALEAADEARRAQRHEDALSHLLQVCALADVQVDASHDGADLSAQVADVLRQLGRPDAARLTRGIAGAPAPGVHDLGRAALGADAPVPAVVEQSADVAPSSTTLLRLVDRSPDRAGGRARGHLPDEALPDQVRAGGDLPALLDPLLELLLGDVPAAERALLQRHGDLPRDATRCQRALVELLLHVAGHDLGRPAPAGGWRALGPLAEAAGPDWVWAPVRVLTERGDLAAAHELDAGATGEPCELSRQLQLLARAALRAAEDDPGASRQLLAEVVQDAVQTGCTLLLPEAAARLVLAEVGDRALALEHFDLFEWSVGAQDAGPRASTHRLLARAVLRASAGEYARAASAAGQAVELARSSGLGPLAARSHLDRARYLTAAGSSEAVAVLAAAREACAAAGVPVPRTVLDQRRPAPAPLPRVGGPGVQTRLGDVSAR